MADLKWEGITGRGRLTGAHLLGFQTYMCVYTSTPTPPHIYNAIYNILYIKYRNLTKILLQSLINQFYMLHKTNMMMSNNSHYNEAPPKPEKVLFKSLIQVGGLNSLCCKQGNTFLRPLPPHFQTGSCYVAQDNPNSLFFSYYHNWCTVFICNKTLYFPE